MPQSQIQYPDPIVYIHVPWRCVAVPPPPFFPASFPSFYPGLGSILARCSPTFYSQPPEPHPASGSSVTLPDLWIDIPACQQRRSFATSPQAQASETKDPRTRLGSAMTHTRSCDGDAVCYCCTLPVIPTQPGATLPVPTGWQGWEGSAARLSNDGVVCERA